jgi:16S rRNA (cytosine967-C5)-methyltransferase
VNIDIVRDGAIDVLLRVLERGMHLDIALAKTLRRKPISERGRRFISQLVYGTVRHKTLCDHVLEGLMRQPLDKLPAAILVILRMGVFQALFCNQVTFPAMVHTSVDLAKKRGHAGTARLVNAVLKRVPQRLEDVTLPDEATSPVAAWRVRYSIPRWLVQNWIDEFGLETTKAICEACNVEAPLTLRVNRLKTELDELQRGLAKAGCLTEKSTPVPEELTVTDGNPFKTKLFQSGHFAIQDAASMLPAHLMEPKHGERILDVCAAPGGKSTHMAELARGGANIVACDVSRRRLAQILDNVVRLETPGLHILAGDGMALPFRGGFSGVLLDAPCTGFGTLRRHPELKWRSHTEDAARMADTQRKLLRCAARLCDNGGRIVYSVCSFTPEETTEIARFAESLDNLKPEDGPEWLNHWRISKGLYRTLPGAGNMDGFFLMRLRKES